MLGGLRVIDASTEVAGPYATKLLADAGADVVKVEGPEGDPLRRWTASGVDLPADEDSALFRFLNTSKRAVVGTVDELAAGADVVIGDGGLDVDGLAGAYSHLVILTISPFGRTGPWADRPATEFTLQAACGSTGSRGRKDRPPLAVGQPHRLLAGAAAADHRPEAVGGPGAVIGMEHLEPAVAAQPGDARPGTRRIVDLGGDASAVAVPPQRQRERATGERPAVGVDAYR